jgi:hypothetical protein
VYLSFRLPAHRKLLPRPCPQCGEEYGGCQWVIRNPEFYRNRSITRRPICILRISHYSKEKYAMSSKKLKYRQGKIWHSFQIPLLGIKIGSQSIPLEKIFSRPSHKYEQSVWFPLSNEWYNYFKKYGWQGIVIEGAHWLNKNKDLKRCQECLIYSKLPLRKYDSPNGYAMLKNWWICESCYAMRMERVTKWKEQKLLTAQKIASDI